MSSYKKSKVLFFILSWARQVWRLKPQSYWSRVTKKANNSSLLEKSFLRLFTLFVVVAEGNVVFVFFEWKLRGWGESMKVVKCRWSEKEMRWPSGSLQNMYRINFFFLCAPFSWIILWIKFSVQNKHRTEVITARAGSFQAPPELILHDSVTPWLHVSIYITMYHKD